MPSQAIFLKLTLKNAGKVKGAVTVPDHEGELYVDSFRFAESNKASAPGKSQVARIGDFRFTARWSQHSPVLMEAVAKNDTVQEAVICCRSLNSKDTEDFLKITIKNGRISRYRVKADLEAIVPRESFSISFQKIAVEHRVRNEKQQLSTTIVGSFDAALLSGKAG